MKLCDLYNNVQKKSKINNDSFLENALDTYQQIGRAMMALGSKTGSRNSEMYSKLAETTARDVTVTDRSYEEAFYVMMTNIWLQNMMSISDSQAENMTHNGLEHFKTVRKIALETGHVDTMEEVKKLYDTISDALPESEVESGRYFWRFDQGKMGGLFPREGETGFYHVISRYVDARTTASPKMSDYHYRLYINCRSCDAHKLLTQYVQLCREQKIPYYFKYYLKPNRKDKIVIYCTKELLAQNIAILGEIGKTHPEISKCCGEMLDLVGNIDDWIGISSEPKTIPGKGQFSYNTMRAEILEDAAEAITLDFIKTHRGKSININGRTIDFDKYFIMKATMVLMEKSEIDKNDKSAYNEIYSCLSRPVQGILPIYAAMKEVEDVVPKKNYMFASLSKPIFTFKLSNGKSVRLSLLEADKILTPPAAIWWS